MPESSTHSSLPLKMPKVIFLGVAGYLKGAWGGSYYYHMSGYAIAEVP
jgi:hypothetical protein